MTLSPELLLALASFFTAGLAALGTYLGSRAAARKDEVTLLREEVARLHARVAEYETKMDTQEEEIRDLRTENNTLTRENIRLTERVSQLEDQQMARQGHRKMNTSSLK